MNSKNPNFRDRVLSFFLNRINAESLFCAALPGFTARFDLSSARFEADPNDAYRFFVAIDAFADGRRFCFFGSVRFSNEEFIDPFVESFHFVPFEHFDEANRTFSSSFMFARAA